MRLLAIGNAYPPHHLGGYEVIWNGVMRHASERGHEVRILTTDHRRPDATDSGEDDGDVRRELQWYWHDHRWRRLGPAARLRLERHNARVLARQLADFQPDVVSWWPVGGMSLSLVESVRRAGLPAILFVLDPWLRYGPQHDLWLRMWRRLGPAAPLGERLTGLPTRVDFDRAGRWVFCSRALRDDTLAAGLRSSDVAVLHPGVEAWLLAEPREHAAPSWRWRLSYIGRVVAQKGVDVAIASLALLPAEARLEVVGEGDAAYRRELEALASRLGVRDRVRFRGSVARAELPTVYRGADAIVFPAKWPEPWGLVPLEAMALGRPVLATGRGGSGEYLLDGVNTLLFDPEDPRTLAAGIERLAADGELRRQLLSGGYSTAQRLSETEFNRLALAELLKASTAPPAGP